jgi:ATP-binding cassette, subfamily B, bacterial MsbA
MSTEPVKLSPSSLLRTIARQESVVTYQRLWSYFKPYWFRLTVGMLAATADGALDAAMPLGIQFYLKAFIEGQQPAWLVQLSSHGVLWLIPLGIVAFTLVQGVVSYLGLYLNRWVGLWVTTNIKLDLYRHFLAYEGKFFDTTNSGDVLVRFNYDVDVACSGLIDQLRGFLARSVSIVTLSWVLLSISWKLAVVAITVLGAMMIPLTTIRKFLRKISNDSVVYAGSLQGHYTESVQGNRVIAAYNLQQHRYNQLNDTLKLVNRLTIKMTQMQGWITPTMRTIAGLGVGLVLLFGTTLIQTHEMTMADFAAFMTSLILLYNPLKNVGNLAVAVQMAYLALVRVFDMMDRESLIQDPPTPQTITQLGRGIVFDHVDFAYVPGRPVLSDFHLTVRPGETVALVGPSGGGKTTIAHLLLRLYDVTSGSITIDGQDLRQVGLTSLRQQVSVVFQDNFIFNASIRDNIVLDNPTVSGAELQAAIDSAYLTDFIASLPDGLDTQVGERGVTLSGGQKQRVAIARALVKNAPLVLLDEATSALDNTSEAIVQRALDKLMENRTVIVIAHRLSTVQRAHQIVLLHEGRVAEQGTHQQLLEQGGLYTQLFNAQFKEPALT